MPRRAAPSTHVVASVRAWFGLGQAELALYLGVSQPLLHAVETGRCRLGPAGQAALLPLLRQLPPPEARAAAEAAAEAADAPAMPASPAAAPPGYPAPDAAELAGRGRQCRHRAARCLAQAAALARQARVAQRWAAALPALLAAAQAPPADPPADPADAERAAEHAAWLAGWLRQRAQPLAPAAATRWHRLRAQATGLLAEAAALET
ncbi:hypothetical protein A0257_07110 [Hymenobacter psoromatis]|nr:hypothetical protein A0257_07110 [Hymenobacter psoromatis]